MLKKKSKRIHSLKTLNEAVRLTIYAMSRESFSPWRGTRYLWFKLYSVVILCAINIAAAVHHEKL